MTDLDRALDAMTEFSARPPAGRLPMAQLLDRARRRRRRVRSQRAAGALAALLIVGGGVIALTQGDDDDTDGVVTSDNDRTSTTGPPATSDPTDPEESTITADPSTDLTDGQVVTLTIIDDPGGELVARQCANEVASGVSGDEWCGQSEHYLRSPAGVSGLEFTVSRLISTANGTVDCAEQSGRCVIRVQPPTRDQSTTWYATLSFRAESASTPNPQVSLDADSAPNGDTITVTGTGYPVGDELMLMECVGRDETTPCDQARSTRVTVDSAGEFEAPFIVSSEVLTDDGWVPCTPCHLQALGTRAPLTSTGPIDIIPDGDPIRPAVSIVEPPPYDPGQLVTLRGTGFQAGAADVTIGTCVPSPDDSPPNCQYPEAGLGVRVGVDGTFELSDYPLPAGDGNACLAASAPCVIAWYPNDGGPAGFTTQLQLRD
jgi:hypothetical protein